MDHQIEVWTLCFLKKNVIYEFLVMVSFLAKWVFVSLLIFLLGELVHSLSFTPTNPATFMDQVAQTPQKWPQVAINQIA